MNIRISNIIGQKFGRLLVVERKGSDDSGRAMWLCKCDCGNEVIVRGRSHRADATQSCGCYNRDRLNDPTSRNNTTHGQSRSRLHNIWNGMRCRCTNPKRHNYCYYGARGITVCDEWNQFLNFREWAMQNGYNDNLTVDRINNDLGYEPSNCRRITITEQQRNKRRGRGGCAD